MIHFSDVLEKQCRRIARQLKKEDSDVSPATSVRREVALLLSDIDGIRRRQEVQRKQLVRRELDLGSQILNLKDRIDLIPSWQERTRAINEAKHTLDQVRVQIHRLNWESEMSLQRIRTRLLELWNIHDQLVEDDGNS